MPTPPIRVIIGDCVSCMRQMAENSIDAIVTDPPYDLTSKDKRDPRRASPSEQQRRNRQGGFMGMTWDATGVAFDPATWEAALRLLKPGGHLLAFGGTRTYHRMAVAIEDAGFEIRDQLQWLYGSGFPKSRDISKAIDAEAGAPRPIIGTWQPTGTARIKGAGNSGRGYEHGELREELPITVPATAEAERWDGWGTALKPAHEPIVLARKPIAARTIAGNVLEYGTGALNIAGGSIGTAGTDDARRVRHNNAGTGTVEHWRTGKQASDTGGASGRWPANVMLDEEAAALLDAQTGERIVNRPSRRGAGGANGRYGPIGAQEREAMPLYNDTGGASRFFYVAKASRRERNAGLEGIEERQLWADAPGDHGKLAVFEHDGRERKPAANHHPTVKPIALMRYLTRLITPPGGLILDPFMGSGTTGIAAILEGFGFVGIDQSEEYAAIACARMEHWRGQARQERLAIV
jgi:DNA modification methylase